MSYSLMEETRDLSIYSRQVEQSVQNAFNATEEWASKRKSQEKTPPIVFHFESQYAK